MNKIFKYLSRAELVVTPTKRLARELASDYNCEQIRSGARAWATPRLLPWQAWLVQLEEQAWWSSSGERRLVLNTDQARVVWEDVLEESALLADHVPASSMVVEVMQAYRTSAEYLIDIPHPELALNDNVGAFAAWARRYASKLTERGWVDPSHLPKVIERYLDAGRLRPEPVNLVCTEDICPAHKRLLEAMTSAGWKVKLIRPEQPRGRAVKVQAASPEEELEQAARWVKQRLLSASEQRLAVIVPDLADSRDRVARTFTEILAPKSLLPGADGNALPFHISIGHSLAEQPMISQALALLDWVGGDTSLGNVSRVLRGQYLAPDSEAVWNRAALEANLRSRGWRNVELASALLRNRESKEPDPGIESTLAPLSALTETERAPAFPSVWAERFDRWLGQAAWPGFRSLNSEEYQVLDAWKNLLGDYSRLDQVIGQLDIKLALARLKKLARDKVFQAEAKDLPVQIMDPREAQGLHFDGAWMLGWHDEAWPQHSHPSPFLPIAAQVAARVPGSSPDVQYEAAVATFDRLGGLAAECVFSWAASQDERPLRPSALIRSLATGSPKLAEHEYYCQTLQRSGDAEPRPLVALPVIPAGLQVSGGTQILEHQSNCPFRAFAQHRLKAEALESPGPGIEARERGKRIHRAMHGIWDRLRSHQRLCSLELEALHSLVEEEVEKAFVGVSVNASGQGRGRLVDMERERVSKLVATLMELERGRPPFTVEEREQGTVEELGGLLLSIRPDRVDVLPDGRQMVLDYKTGQANPADWLRDRPTSVQLPIYLIARAGQGFAALFVSLGAGNVMFAGILADDDMMQNDKSQCRRLDWAKSTGFQTWDELLYAWRARFVRLAEEFRQGEIQVDPADKGKVCEYCHLGTLCRVTERGRAVSDDQ